MQGHPGAYYSDSSQAHHLQDCCSSFSRRSTGSSRGAKKSLSAIGDFLSCTAMHPATIKTWPHVKAPATSGVTAISFTSTATPRLLRTDHRKQQVIARTASIRLQAEGVRQRTAASRIEPLKCWSSCSGVCCSRGVCWLLRSSSSLSEACMASSKSLFSASKSSCAVCHSIAAITHLHQHREGFQYLNPQTLKQTIRKLQSRTPGDLWTPGDRSDPVGLQKGEEIHATGLFCE